MNNRTAELLDSNCVPRLKLKVKLTIFGILSISTTLFHLCLSMTCCSPPSDSTACHRFARSVSSPLTCIHTHHLYNLNIVSIFWLRLDTAFVSVSSVIFLSDGHVC